MTYLKHCQFCGNPVERTNNQPVSTCFSCKVKRRNERNKGYHKKWHRHLNDLFSGSAKPRNRKVDN